MTNSLLLLPGFNGLEGNKICLDGSKHFLEGNKICLYGYKNFLEGNKIHYDPSKTFLEGNTFRLYGYKIGQEGCFFRLDAITGGRYRLFASWQRKCLQKESGSRTLSRATTQYLFLSKAFLLSADYASLNLNYPRSANLDKLGADFDSLNLNYLRFTDLRQINN